MTSLVAARLARYADMSDSDACWSWTGARNAEGYGRITIDGKTLLAHRVSYEHSVGAIPPHLEIDHLCRNPACVNPAHLEAVTHRVNLLRRPRRLVCKNGHAFNDENTYWQAGRRQCRTCNRKRVAEYQARRRERAA